MRRFFLGLAAAAAVFCILLFYPAGQAGSPQKEATAAATAAAATESIAKPPAATPAGKRFDAKTSLLVLLDGQSTEMSLQDYLTGVLLAEMPTDFPSEALKAQAVASRTFALHQQTAGKHLNADVCGDSDCCQGWVSSEGFSAEAVKNAAEAVRATDGLVLCYDGALIDATFFSCSGGSTEAAAEVWGSDVPYLQAVESPNEEDAPRYCDETSLPRAEFVRILQTENPAITGAEPLLGTITRTQGGGVATATLCGQVFEGTTLRRLFGLRSTDLTIRDEGERIVLTTRGFGHRVGMSQYGARAMAEAGDDFETILLHYYQGAALYRLELSE